MKVLLSGCGGAMGHMLQDMIAEKDNITIAAGVDKYPPKDSLYPVFEKYSDCDVPCDAIIDFSHPSALNDLLKYATSHKIPVVLSTTGHDDAQKNQISQASNQIPVFKSANMTLGINLMIELLKKTTEFLDGFDIEIIEKHHNKKADAPSGTALMLADGINEVLEQKKEYKYGRCGANDKRNENEIGLHAVRGGTIVGEHQVHFIGPDEIIEIRHTASSKKVFAEGAIRAAQFLVGKPTGQYEMKDML